MPIVMEKNFINRNYADANPFELQGKGFVSLLEPSGAYDKEGGLKIEKVEPTKYEECLACQ